jgi:hypothetical protein
MPDRMLERMSEHMPESMSDSMSGYMPERMSDRMAPYIHIYYYIIDTYVYTFPEDRYVRNYGRLVRQGGDHSKQSNCEYIYGFH